MSLFLKRAWKYLRVALRLPRWREYEGYLRQAMNLGYTIVSLETWLADPHGVQGKTLILRHDVEMYPEGARHMSGIERRLGLTSTFYFRWYAFDPAIVARIRSNGSQVGLHYETLTRYAIEHHLNSPEQITPGVMAECRGTLREEVACFKSLIGVCNTVVAHGDQRTYAIGRNNADLLDGQPYQEYGVIHDPDHAAALPLIDRWVSDGEGAPVYWSSGVSLSQAFAQGHRVILLNTHPHHWALGAVVVGKRLASYLGLLFRHPTRVERATPEVMAWGRHRALWKVGSTGTPGQG